MSEPAGERLYQLLPAIYRVRDAEAGEPLRALLAIAGQELDLLEADIGQLYENWFIETCEEWAVPYIGDLLGVRPLHPVSPQTVSQRARVANTISYRRAKGTAALLERLARDVTAWPARAVEFFQNLSTTQHLNRLRPANRATLDLRETDRLDLLGSPFDEAAYTADLHRRGRYNIPNIGLFLWRLQSYPVTRGTARPVEPAPAGGGGGTGGGGTGAPAGAPKGYTFHPLMIESPLFNRPRPEEDQAGLAGEIHLPGRLRRMPLHLETEAARRSGSGPAPDGYFGSPPVLGIYLDGSPVAVAQLYMCDLGAWTLPPMPGCRPPGAADETLPVGVAVDPVRGRLMLSTGENQREVEVSYAYGFSGDIGGGPYDRADSLRAARAEPATWSATVTRGEVPVGRQAFATLADALAAFEQAGDGTDGILTIADSRTYAERLHLNLGTGSLRILAADGVRPHLCGEILVKGKGAALTLNGLLIEGQLKAGAGALSRLTVEHCTLIAREGVKVATRANGTPAGVTVRRSICGPLHLKGRATLTVTDTFLLAREETALHGPETDAVLKGVTALGEVSVRTLEAENSLFTGRVEAALHQSGCVRFSYVPPGSRVPRPYRCQPDLAISQAGTEAERIRIRRNLVPVFATTAYGDPEFGRLDESCPAEITAGAEDQGEMGALHFLQQPQREANLRMAVEEYLRFGLEVGYFSVQEKGSLSGKVGAP